MSAKPHALPSEPIEDRIDRIEENVEVILRYVRAIGRSTLAGDELAELEWEVSRRITTVPSPPPDDATDPADEPEKA